MGYTLTVSGDSVADLVAAVNALAGGAPPAPAAVETGKKPGPGRPAKAAVVGKTAAEMAAEMGLTPPAAAPTPAAPVVQAYTEEQVRAKLSELMAHRTGDADETTGMTRVQTVLAKLGVQQIKAVPASRYAELVQFIDAA